MALQEVRDVDILISDIILYIEKYLAVPLKCHQKRYLEHLAKTENKVIFA